MGIRSNLYPTRRGGGVGARSGAGFAGALAIASGGGGQAEANLGADLAVAQPDLTAVGLHDRPGDGQAQAGPSTGSRGVGPAAVERGEYLLALLSGDAVTVV